jgi:hypothetical protein
MSKRPIVQDVCKLCLQHRRLCESHLLPRGIYTRSRGPENTTPFIATVDGERKSQHQYKQHLLCSECEQRFSKNGEAYALELMNSRDQKFQLLAILRQSQPMPPKTGDLWLQYPAQNTPTIDRKKLAYFAISVFWRASVATWKDTDGQRLVRYLEDEFQRAAVRRPTNIAAAPANPAPDEKREM